MKQLVRTISMAAIAIVAALSIASCSDGDDDYWWGPDNSNNYYDSNLMGTWQLIQINGNNVTAGQTNYLRFTGKGSGYYYYYSGGLRSTQRIAWVCTAGFNRDTITIHYQDGTTSTMNYYFTAGADYLYLNWTTYTGQQMSYCYRYMNNSIPW